MKKISLLVDYENTLLNIKKSYKVKMDNESDSKSLESVRYLLRFVFEDLLHWSPEEVKHYLNADIVHQFKLENCLKKIFPLYPSELNISTDYFYIASWVYPDQVPYNKEKVVLSLFNDILDGNSSFSNRFFSHEDGKENFRICLRFLISREFFAKPVEEIYEFFSVSSRAYTFLQSASLGNHYKKFYDSFLEAVHDCLPEADRNEMLYRYYEFTSRYIKVRDRLRKEKILEQRRIKREKRQAAATELERAAENGLSDEIDIQNDTDISAVTDEEADNIDREEISTDDIDKEDE